MTSINLSNVSSAISWPELMMAAHDMTNGWFGTGLLLGFWIIGFVAMKKYRLEPALISSTFSTFVLSVLFRSMGLISDFVMFLLLIISAFSIVISFFDKN